MKTNKFSKSILTILVILTVCLFALPASADKGSRDKGRGWGSDARGNGPAAEVTSAAPDQENPASEKPGKKDRNIRPDHPMDYDERSEGREKRGKHGIDLSELPEDPTDEEIVEFFKKYFMGKDPDRAPGSESDDDKVKDYRPNKEGRSLGERKGKPCRQDEQADETVREVPEAVTEEPETAPETPAEVTDVSETASEAPEAEPVEEQPAESKAEDAA